MSAQDYDKYFEVVKASYIRQGTVLSSTEDQFTPGTLEALSLITDASKHSGFTPINDLKRPTSYIEDLRSRLFQVYLEYKKVSESVTLPEWLNTEISIARDIMADIAVGVVEPQIPVDTNTQPPVREGGARGGLNGLGSLDGLGTLHSEPLAKDLDGYDVWYPVFTYGKDDDGYDLWVDPESFNSLVEEPTEVVSSSDFLKSLGLSTEEITQVEEDNPYHEDDEGRVPLDELVIAPENYLGVLYSEPLYKDADGYDVWADSGLGAIVEPEDPGTFHGEVYGTDSDGYDIWVKPESQPDTLIPAAELFDDGFEKDDSNYESPLGTFHGEVVGTDDNGYDIWSAAGEGSTKGTAEVTEVAEGADGSKDLGTFHGKVVGTDDDGYDIWGKAEEEEASSNEVEDGSESASTSDDPFAGIKDDSPKDDQTDALRADPFAGTLDAPKDSPFGSSSLDHSSPFADTTPDYKESPFGSPTQDRVPPRKAPSKSEIKAKLESSDRTADFLRNSFRLFGK